jgi:hypothetical protein
MGMEGVIVRGRERKIEKDEWMSHKTLKLARCHNT